MLCLSCIPIASSTCIVSLSGKASIEMSTKMNNFFFSSLQLSMEWCNFALYTPLLQINI